jgi:hypothetical protein
LGKPDPEIFMRANPIAIHSGLADASQILRAAE